MNKKFILVFCLSLSIAPVNAALIDTLFVYMKNCTQKFSSFFVVTPAKKLAQPQGRAVSTVFDSKNVHLGQSSRIIQKNLDSKRNRFNTEAFLQQSEQYFDPKFCGSVDQTIGGSIVIPINYDKVDTHFELLACGKGDKFRGQDFINKKFDPSFLDGFDMSKKLVKIDKNRPSAQAV